MILLLRVNSKSILLLKKTRLALNILTRLRQRVLAAAGSIAKLAELALLSYPDASSSTQLLLEEESAIQVAETAFQTSEPAAGSSAPENAQSIESVVPVIAKCAEGPRIYPGNSKCSAEAFLCHLEQ
jgi:hypothetical protein